MELNWVPDSCTLPTAEQPLRSAEFDKFFATFVRKVERLSPEHVRFALEHSPDTASQAADLAVRETSCCSFFTFTLRASGEGLALDVGVPAAQSAVLEALATRAAG